MKEKRQPNKLLNLPNFEHYFPLVFTPPKPLNTRLRKIDYLHFCTLTMNWLGCKSLAAHILILDCRPVSFMVSWSLGLHSKW